MPGRVPLDEAQRTSQTGDTDSTTALRSVHDAAKPGLSTAERRKQGQNPVTIQSDLPVVFLACQVFESLLDEFIPEDLADQVGFLDYGLHATPKRLGTTLQTAIDEIQTPSLVVLGYGLCGNGLRGLRSGQHTLLIPRMDDCISMLLGSHEAYRREFSSAPGTYYLTKGWLEAGSNPLEEYKVYAEEYGPEQAQYVMDLQYQNYERVVLVAHTRADLAAYRGQAKEVAAYCEQWGMRYQEILGSDAYVRRLVEVASDVSKADSEFLVVPPGGEVSQEDFIR
jgi:hypothetical protein